MKNEDEPTPLGRAARLVIALAGLWLATGAVFKLFWGTPADLPQVVRDVPLSLGSTYRLAIAIELVVAALALLKPRWAWPLLVGALLLFDAILGSQIAAGQGDCGCFGSKLSVSPWTMLAIDSALLLALLWTRPWSSLRGRGSPLGLVALACVALAATPWLLDREASTPDGGEVVAGGETVAGGTLGRPWVQLDLGAWVGKDLGQTELGKRTDVYAMPPDALWVIYRTTCEHCADHLSALTDTEIGQRYIVLCRLEEPHDSEENRLVHRMPQGDFVFHCELADTTEYVITTPGEIEVEGFVVVRGEEGIEVEGH